MPDLFRVLSKLLLAALFTLGALRAPAAVPVNDRCPFAIVIPTNGPFPHFTATVDITEATVINDPPLPSCQTDVSRSVWYTFRPAITDTYRITTCAASVTNTTISDTVMAIYTASNGCGTVYTQIAGGCNDDSCGYQSEISALLTNGITYYIVVWQFGLDAPPPGQGLLRLGIERSQSLNDDCTSPQELQLNIPALGRTLGAKNDYDLGNSLCFTGIGQTPVDTPGLEVVFAFTAPRDDTYSFRVKNYNIAADPDYDLVIYLSPTCPLPDPKGTMNDCLAAANRNVSIAEEITCVPLAAAQRVYLFADDRFAINRGSSFTVEVTRCIPEIETNTAGAAPMIFETTGSIDPVNETDYFALGAFPPGSRVFALIDAIASNRPDFDLRVVNSTDTLEYDTDNNDVPFGQSSGNVAGTPLTADNAWLRVNHAPAIAQPYRLYAVVQPPFANATPETEPNGTFAQAQTAPNNYFSGFLPGPTDEDFYAFDALAGDLIFLGLDADPLRDRSPIDAQLELLNNFGSTVLVVDDPSSLSNTNTSPGSLNAGRPFSPAESLAYRAPYTGRYYARVSISPFAFVATNMIGDYLLSVSRNGFLGVGATNIPPAIINLAAPSVGQNAPFVLTGTIRDPDLGPRFTLLINWGDGSPNTTLALDVGEYTFQATHQYLQQATFPISLTVQDINGATATAGATAQVTTPARPQIKSTQYLPDGTVRLQFQSPPNATYRIQASDNLRTWSTLTNYTADPAGNFELQEAPPLFPRRFYRALWP